MSQMFEIKRIARKLEEAIESGEAVAQLRPLRLRLRKVDASALSEVESQYLHFVWLTLYMHAYCSDPALLSDRRALNEAYVDHDRFGVDTRGLVRKLQASYEEYVQDAVTGDVASTFYAHYMPKPETPVVRAIKKWVPLIEALKLADSDKLDWMCQMIQEDES
jgi:hypothetical protein